MPIELFKDQRGELKMKLDTAEDRIAAYMMGKVERDVLSDKDVELKNRWLKVWSLLQTGLSPNQAVINHLKALESDGKEISERTAWYDLHHATRLWGALGEVSYQATLILMKEYAHQAFQKSSNSKEMSMAIKMMMEIADRLNAISALGDDGGVKPSTFILAVKMSDGRIERFDLDDYKDAPEDITSQIIEDLQSDVMSPDEFIDYVELEEDKKNGK